MLVVDPLTGSMYQVPDQTEIPMRRLDGDIAGPTEPVAQSGPSTARSPLSLPENVRWLYQAERLAAQMNCGRTSYSAQGPGVEFFEASCASNRVSIRCDFGQCTALN
jgi:hypothetical protein